jgi:hypothetical protein
MTISSGLPMSWQEWCNHDGVRKRQGRKATSSAANRWNSSGRPSVSRISKAMYAPQPNHAPLGHP